MKSISFLNRFVKLEGNFCDVVWKVDYSVFIKSLSYIVINGK